MPIYRAKTAGFCMGVRLAIEQLEQALCVSPSESRRIVMYGSIIHNPKVLADFAARGVVSVDSADDLQEGDMVVIRAHGLPQQEEKTLHACGVQIIDATCPKVKKAQLAIAKATASGLPIWIFGEKKHPEVQGLISYAGGTCHVFGSLESLEQTPPPSDTAFVLAAQTTQDKVFFDQIAEQLTRTNNQAHVLSTICAATSLRQEETIAIAQEVDMMFIVGGRESGNTRRLVQIAADQGVLSMLIESVDDLPDGQILRRASLIGLSAGASTPYSLIDEIEAALKKKLAEV